MLYSEGDMMFRQMFTIVTIAVFFSAVMPVHAEEVPTVVIPLGQTDDKFDRDFEDDFDNEFDDQGGGNEVLIADPLEGFNRSMFYLNDKLYFYLMKPVARGYRAVVPRPARTSVSNAFHNLATPVRTGNSLLQFKFRDVGVELYRLIFNSTVGLGGLFDPAATAEVKKVDDEDFGQTLGVYGVGHGFYLVLPLLGPSSLRDAVGGFADTAADPLRYVDMKFLEYLGVKSYKTLNALSLDRDTYEGIVRDALDPYSFIKAAYAQRRLAQVGKTKYNLNMFENAELNPFRWLGE